MIRAMTARRFGIALAGLALALGGAGFSADASARERWSHGVEAPNGYAPRSTADRRLSLEQAVGRVRRATGGRVLDAREAGDGYRVKVLTRDGEVRVVYVDARSGEMR
jgi:uncharacterized membrane protein YkoI